MKELYKPVFWCGFALSLSALYASSELSSVETESGARKPVLMQINIGQATSETVDSQVLDRNEMIAGEAFVPAPDVSESPIPIELDVQPVSTPTNSTSTSVFFQEAQEALSNR